MQRIFFSPSLNREITDVSGVKTLAQIQTLYPAADYQVLDISEDEAVELDNGTLVKFNLKQRRQQRGDAHKQDRKDAINELKTIGLSNKAIQTLFG